MNLQNRTGLVQRAEAGVRTTKFCLGLLFATLPLASKACTELKCGCKSKNGCGARCGYKKANWSFTGLCGCNCRAVSIIMKLQSVVVFGTYQNVLK